MEESLGTEVKANDKNYFFNCLHRSTRHTPDNLEQFRTKFDLLPKFIVFIQSVQLLLEILMQNVQNDKLVIKIIQQILN